jgi:hypothetical protein
MLFALPLQVLNEAARQASSFFRSCQAVMQLESPANDLTVASDSLAAQIVKQRTAQAALLPWTARTWHERLFEKCRPFSSFFSLCFRIQWQ